MGEAEPRWGPDGGIILPDYPYDRLAPAMELAQRHEGGAVDLSIGTPCDPPSPEVVAALAGSNTERGYPSSVGSPELRRAARSWFERRFGVEVPEGALAACIGTKELVAGMPGWLRLRSPSRDVVLYPSLSYPTYEMGAVLARCIPHAVPVLPSGQLDLASVPEELAQRALVLWVNSPSNPTGQLDDLHAAASWGRERGVLVASDECYTELTWDSPPSTILSEGLEGVLALHSLSKRSNMAGLRVGFYAGDPEVVHFLSELRKHAGFMVPGPVQAAGVAALADDAQVRSQRKIYLERLSYLSELLSGIGWDAPIPRGGLYIWASSKSGESGWEMTDWLARRAGALVSPGELYGPGAGHVRVAAVQPMERLEVVGERLLRG